ncbi:MAG: HAD family hydrolase, partial [Nocardioidaceae bacterium]
MHTGRQALIFDADDTLWENNVLYERVIDDFLDWVAHPSLDRTQTRRILDETEAANTVAHGYGSQVFLRSLRDCFARLNERPVDAAEAEQIEALAVALVEHRIELLPGVADTLEVLGQRHDLYLLTKGDVEEQRRKVDASDLGHHFDEVRVVREKDVETYRAVVQEYALTPSYTWMIGNSPRSDILPARGAGLNAVYIPDPNPWVLEHADVDAGDERVLHLGA